MNYKSEDISLAKCLSYYQQEILLVNFAVNAAML